MRTAARACLASCIAVVALLVVVPSALAALSPYYTATGSVQLSQNGYASNTGPVTKPILKPAGATVKAAFLFEAAVPGYAIPDSGDITLDGTPVTFSDTPVESSFSNETRAVDVTSIVKPIIDAAPAGNVEQTVSENLADTDLIDGEILAVVFNDPLVTNNTVTLMYGTQDTTGDTFHVGFAQPINLADSSIQFALGISFSYDEPNNADQYSLVDVNGTPPDPSNPTAGPDPARLTTQAGGQDDQDAACETASANGCLLTVGGVGDDPANPTDPFATPAECTMAQAYACDDELYTLGAPFVHNGDTALSVYTLNPSNNDDILYSSFVFTGLAAVVGEGITLAPPTQTVTLGGQATVTAHLQDADGNPLTATPVTFTVTSGPDAGKTVTVSTDASGDATYSYSSSQAGTDTVSASFVTSANATDTSNAVSVIWNAPASTYCEYSQSSQYCECQYNESASYCETSTTTTNTSTTASGAPQTITPPQGSTPSGVTVKSTTASTLVNVKLPAGTAWRKFYMYTVHGVSFGANHGYRLLKKDILLFNGRTKLTYNITQLSRPHGRIHLVLKRPVTNTTFKVAKNVFEFTPRERRYIQAHHIKKTTVTVQVTTTTGKIYTVSFKTVFGALVVIKFH